MHPRRIEKQFVEASRHPDTVSFVWTLAVLGMGDSSL